MLTLQSPILFAFDRQRLDRLSLIALNASDCVRVVVSGEQKFEDVVES
jgi:hypothetical protein